MGCRVRAEISLMKEIFDLNYPNTVIAQVVQVISQFLLMKEIRPIEA